MKTIVIILMIYIFNMQPVQAETLTAPQVEIPSYNPPTQINSKTPIQTQSTTSSNNNYRTLLRNCTPTTFTFNHLPSKLTELYDSITAQVFGWVNDKCHLIIKANTFKAVKQTEAIQEHPISMECLLTKTTISKVITIANNFQQNVKDTSPTAPNNLFTSMVETLAQDCSTTMGIIK